MQQELNINQTNKTELIQRRISQINGKYVKLPFFAEMPLTSVDLQLLLDEFDPNKMSVLSDSGEDTDFLGAVTYRLIEHDDVVRHQRKMLNQITLASQSSTFRYITQTKLKLIDPATELYKLRYREYLKSYIALPQIPEYLEEFLSKMISDDELVGEEHTAFWNSLFTTNHQGRLKSAHFMQWHWKQQQSRGADVFITPVPYVDSNNPELINRAIEMNLDATEFIKDGEVATVFVIETALFNNKGAIEKITNHLDKHPTKVNLIKFVNPEKILQPGFGQYARANFELFLRVIKSLKEEDPERIFGVMDGGGFGYALVGGGIFDFFTDTVSNYPPYYRPTKKRKRQHRGMLNAETWSIEKFEGVKNFHKEFGVLMHDCRICKKYNQVNPEDVSMLEWSEDCRKHALHMWNSFTREYVEAKATSQEKLFFDKVQNSDYAIVGSILRRTNQ